jgi:hypothetical protein
VLLPSGQLNFQAALSTDHQTLKLLKTAPDQMTQQEYRDSNSGTKAFLDLHAPGNNDVAILQLVGASSAPLAFAGPETQVSPELNTALLSFPYGLSQPLALPKLTFVRAAVSASDISLDQPLNTGESGAPLLTPDGKVLALAEDAKQCVPADALRSLIP